MVARKGKKKTGRLEMEDRLFGMVERASLKGESLPGEPTLANMLGVSRPSLREALVRLERDGVIHHLIDVLEISELKSERKWVVKLQMHSDVK